MFSKLNHKRSKYIDTQYANVHAQIELNDKWKENKNRYFVLLKLFSLPAFDILVQPSQHLLQARAHYRIPLLLESIAWTNLLLAFWLVPIFQTTKIPWNRFWTSCPNPTPQSIVCDLYLQASAHCTNHTIVLSILWLFLRNNRK